MYYLTTFFSSTNQIRLLSSNEKTLRHRHRCHSKKSFVCLSVSFIIVIIIVLCFYAQPLRFHFLSVFSVSFFKLQPWEEIWAVCISLRARTGTGSSLGNRSPMQTSRWAASGVNSESAARNISIRQNWRKVAENRTDRGSRTRWNPDPEGCWFHGQAWPWDCKT